MWFVPSPHFFSQSNFRENAIIIMPVPSRVDPLTFAQFVSPAFEISFQVSRGNRAGARRFVIIVCV